MFSSTTFPFLDNCPVRQHPTQEFPGLGKVLLQSLEDDYVDNTSDTDPGMEKIADIFCPDFSAYTIQTT